MGFRKVQLVNGEIYHIVLRAIDDNLIFKDRDDYYRGIFSLYEFNNAKPITIRERRKEREKIKKLFKEMPAPAEKIVDEREKLVNIFSFIFMPNHPHLLLRQLKDEGITKFMRKLGTGYGGYFNRKYDRKGHVFQNKFLATPIKNEEQLKNVFVYIHTNSISLIESKWKERGIADPEKVIKFLGNYKWSSYQDYIGEKNFPSVTDRDFIWKIMGGEKGCKEFVDYWIRYKGKFKQLLGISLK